MCGSCRPCSSPHTGQAPSFGGGIVNRPSRSSNNQPPSLLGTDRAKRKPLRPVTVFPVCQFYADRFPRDYQLPVAGLWAFALGERLDLNQQPVCIGTSTRAFTNSATFPCCAGLSRLPSLSPSDTGRPVALFRSLPPSKSVFTTPGSCGAGEGSNLAWFSLLDFRTWVLSSALRI